MRHRGENAGVASDTLPRSGTSFNDFEPSFRDLNRIEWHHLTWRAAHLSSHHEPAAESSFPELNGIR